MKSVLVINDNSVCLPFRTVISGLCTGYTSEIWDQFQLRIFSYIFFVALSSEIDEIFSI